MNLWLYIFCSFINILPHKNICTNRKLLFREILFLHAFCTSRPIKTAPLVSKIKYALCTAVTAAKCNKHIFVFWHVFLFVYISFCLFICFFVCLFSTWRCCGKHFWADAHCRKNRARKKRSERRESSSTSSSSGLIFSKFTVDKPNESNM